MALLFMESFDGVGANRTYMSKWFAAPNNLRTDLVRTGSCSASNNDMGRNVTVGSTTTIVGFAYYFNGANQTECALFNVGSNTTFTQTQAKIVLQSDGKIAAYRSYNALLETTAAAVLVPSAWNFIEWKLTNASGTSGAYVVKVNGATVLSNLAANTAGSVGATVQALVMNVNYNCPIDDLYMLDSTGAAPLNDFIGDCRVACITPQTGNGSNVGLTCSTGTDHGALVDEFPPTDDTDYNYSTTPGVKDTYNFTNLPTTGTVKAVQATLRTRKTDSPTKTLAAVVRQGGADYDGASQTTAIGYAQYQQIWETRPSDSAAWTIADVDGAEFGMKVVS